MGQKQHNRILIKRFAVCIKFRLVDILSPIKYNLYDKYLHHKLHGDQCTISPPDIKTDTDNARLDDARCSHSW